jgi:hypothetical protein
MPGTTAVPPPLIIISSRFLSVINEDEGNEELSIAKYVFENWVHLASFITVVCFVVGIFL